MTYFTFSCDFEIHYGICLIIQGTNNKPGFILHLFIVEKFESSLTHEHLQQIIKGLEC